MADKTKAELQKEAEAKGVPLDSDATKAEIEDALEAQEEGNLPDVYQARFDPSSRKATVKAEMNVPSVHDAQASPGPNAAAGVGGGVGTTTTTGTTGTTTTR